MQNYLTHHEINILVVARWPLGGIRTYMRYIFRYFPQNYKITIIAAATQEADAISIDAEEYKAKLLLVQDGTIGKFIYYIINELMKKKYHIILSQGFISAVAVYFSNIIFCIPHIFTIHGILEPKYFAGRFPILKRHLLCKMLKGVTVLYGVSNDILSHLYEQLPNLKYDGPKSIVIPNGIEPLELKTTLLNANTLSLRDTLKIDSSTFLFGFFGRFMEQKGFDLLINAVDVIHRTQNNDRPFAVIAVGSGDYLLELKQNIHQLGLNSFFYFLPFQSKVFELYPQVDAVVIPSRWEACPLLPMEVLCTGTTLIASDCIGLRETVANTPTMIFPSEDLNRLVDIMQSCIKNNDNKRFQEFKPTAFKRYDVAKSARSLINLIETVVEIK